jgi:hypothetical protein
MKKTVAILIVSPLLCSTALGGTVQQRATETPFAEGEQLRVSGNQSTFGSARGMGQDMPLYKALGAIIPRGYTLRTVGVERWLLDEPISWSGGRDWTEVLGEAISAYPELQIDIASGAKVVILRQVNPAADGGTQRLASNAGAGRADDAESAEPAPAKKKSKLELADYLAEIRAGEKEDDGPYMDMPRLKPKRGQAFGVAHASLVIDPAKSVAKAEAKPEAKPDIKADAAAPQPVKIEKVALADYDKPAAKAEAKPAAKPEAKPAAPAKTPAQTDGEMQGDLVKMMAADAQAWRNAVANPAPAASAAAVPEAVPPATPAPAWEVMLVDKTVKSSFERWASISGWQVSWELPVDYPIDAKASITGSFEEAVEVVVKSIAHAETPMKAIFYAGNKVLRIVAKGVE